MLDDVVGTIKQANTIVKQGEGRFDKSEAQKAIKHLASYGCQILDTCTQLSHNERLELDRILSFLLYASTIDSREILWLILSRDIPRLEKLIGKSLSMLK